ncbi:hemerythrin-like metal-binding protein [Candidatus Magnetoovum chiemensis]|nr:hemerythrin-like metal-binding protein [Candidatus Magnetoovum chiemensis]
MALINWCDDLKTDISDIDAHHQKLVHLINLLHDAVIEEKGDIAVGTVLPELLNYTIYHFFYEEQLMQSSGYPLYDDHKNEHNKLIDTTLKYYEQYNEGNKDIAKEVLELLRVWLVNL